MIDGRVIFEFEPGHAVEPEPRYRVEYQWRRLHTRLEPEWRYRSQHHNIRKAIEEAVFCANQWHEPSRVVDTWAEGEVD